MTFNRPQSLRRCLESLAEQARPPAEFEVIVVDSSDIPVRGIIDEFSSRLNLRHSAGPNLGVAGNRNRGAVLALGRYIAFLDDDCVACADWLEKMFRVLSTNTSSLVGGAVENPLPGSACATAGQAITEAVDAFYNQPGKEPGFFPGLNFACERQRFLDLGGCDERFGRLAAEDRDFIDRWRLSGGGLVACPDAIVLHEHRSSVLGFARQYFNYGRGAWRYHRLRRQRTSGKMWEDVKLHFSLPRYFKMPLQSLSPGMRLKVVLLLFVWQAANFAGFTWQALREQMRWNTG